LCYPIKYTVNAGSRRADDADRLPQDTGAIGELRDQALVRDDVAAGLLSTEVSRSTTA
jgi:hypothetical protein